MTKRMVSVRPPSTPPTVAALDGQPMRIYRSWGTVGPEEGLFNMKETPNDSSDTIDAVDCVGLGVWTDSLSSRMICVIQHL